MDESIPPKTKILASHVLPYDKISVCFSTLVLSANKYKSLEAESVAKHGLNPISEEAEVISMDVQSIVSKKLFERDLAERKSQKSCTAIVGS